MNAATKDILRELAGIHCRCGANKQPRNTFCQRCFYTLPKEKRNDLYKRIGAGYEEAYEAACEFLNARAKDKIPF